ncbi:mitochondrial carrier domain-containing protein [Powellomyces hirtus]|nr:mitochondrial carrier domain-containing protein [Powellomyces hirtus]
MSGDYHAADSYDVVHRLNPYASATATLDAGDPQGLFIPDWEDLEEDAEPSSTLNEAVVYAAVQFLATAIASPLEVVTILKQVQFLPSDAYLDRYHSRIKDGETTSNSGDASEADPDSPDDDDDATDDAEDDDAEDDDDEAHVLRAADDYDTRHRVYAQSVIERAEEIAAADTTGYLLVAHSEDEPTRPPYQLPPLEGSTMATISQIAAHKDEGLSALWKGQVPAWTHEMTHSFLQPGLEHQLTHIVHDQDALLDLTTDLRVLLVKIASHSLTSLLLSPLDLIRTRLVVQTAHPYHRKYRGPVHCLTTVLREEGWAKLYMGRHLIPTVLRHTLAPVFHLCGEWIVSSVREMDTYSGLTLGILQLGLKVLELGVIMPLETVQRRLMCQIITTRVPEDRPFESAVERNPIPYTGMLDCLGRIVIEEGGTRTRRLTHPSPHHHHTQEHTHRNRSKRKDKQNRHRRPQKQGERTWWSSWGVSGLYRGFQLRLVSSVAAIVIYSLVDYLEVPDDANVHF